MFDQLSETVIELYRRYAGQWDAARRASVWNDRDWLEAFARELGRGMITFPASAGTRDSGIGRRRLRMAAFSL